MLLRKSRNNSGQAVLIVLLSLSVVLIIVMYIMSRSITDITLTSKEGDSMRAFSAAEAGIEQALIIGSSIPSTVIGDASFTANVSEYGKNTNEVVYPISLKSGEIATFWFRRAGDATVFSGPAIKVCWGDRNYSPSDDLTPAVEISVFYLESGVYKVARYVFDPNAARRTSNYFDLAGIGGCSVDGTLFQFFRNFTLPVTGTVEYMTVKVLYNTTESHKVGIDVSANAGATLPSQGIKINSDGKSADSNRSIEVFQMYPVVPSVFMNSIFSSSGIVK